MGSHGNGSIGSQMPFSGRYAPYTAASRPNRPGVAGGQRRVHYTMRERPDATRERFNHVTHHALQPRGIAGGLPADKLAYWGQVYEQWKQIDAAFVPPEAAACCICGRWAFGCTHSRLREKFKQVSLPVGQVPIGVAANPFLHNKMTCGTPIFDSAGTQVQKWWFCEACFGNPRRQQQQQQLQVPMTAQHARDICELLTLPGGALLYTSVLRCPVRFEKRADSLLHATPTNVLPVVGGPLVAFDGSDQEADPARVQQVSVR